MNRKKMIKNILIFSLLMLSVKLEAPKKRKYRKPGPRNRKQVATSGPMKYINMAKNMYELYQKMGKNSKGGIFLNFI